MATVSINQEEEMTTRVKWFGKMAIWIMPNLGGGWPEKCSKGDLDGLCIKMAKSSTMIGSIEFVRAYRNRIPCCQGAHILFET